MGRGVGVGLVFLRDGDVDFVLEFLGGGGLHGRVLLGQDGRLGVDGHGGDGEIRFRAAGAVELWIKRVGGDDGVVRFHFFGVEEVFEVHRHLADEVVTAVVENDRHRTILRESGKRN